jgi:peptidoglycan/LPS O-acetylase OafA/YrhL
VLRLPSVEAPSNPAASNEPEARTRSFLPEVQALRALAVLLVVLYHFWPNRLHGGFVGVDVFFVISGFLITSHLRREVQTRGRIGLANFYARRARRLLPAALVVLIAAAAGTLAVLPSSRWSTTADQLLASSLYVQNWLLAAQAVDYSASQNAATAVQHFWSLSVEEQFYLGWPPLILLLLLLSRRLGTIRRDSLLFGGILAVSALSFGWSVYATGTQQAAAYFTTPTRIWELGAGATLALWSGMRAEGREPHQVRSAVLPIALRWLGLAAILVAAVALSSATPFPGYLALLPVLGTVAVIAAGETGRRDPLSTAVHLRPVQFLGTVSYSLYLWHWPAIVMLPFALERTPGAKDKLLLLAACVALSWLTKELVEDPGQRWRVLARPALTAVATAAAMLLVAATSAVIWHRVGQEEAAAEARLAAVSSEPCFGAAAMGPEGAACADPFGEPATLTLTDMDRPWYPLPGSCVRVETPLVVNTCTYSSGPPSRTVALVGDSHAEHWRGAVHTVAEQLGWRVVELARGACPATHARVLAFDGGDRDAATVDACREWADAVDAELERLAPDFVFTSGYVSAMGFDEDPARSVETGAEGFVDIWQGWADRGMRVFVLRDVPSTGGVNIPECLALNVGDPLACARPRSEAVQPDAMTVAADMADSDRIQLVDLTDRFCDRKLCYAAIGGAIVNFDRDHMTGSFSRSLAPYLLESIGGGLQ